MKVGDLVIEKTTGDIKIIVDLGQELYSPRNNTKPNLCEILFFGDGTCDWEKNWRDLQWWDK